MKTRKFLMAVTLILVCAFLAAGCGRKEEGGDGTSNGAQTHGPSESTGADGTGADKNTDKETLNEKDPAATAPKDDMNTTTAGTDDGVLDELGDDVSKAADDIGSDVSKGVRDATRDR